MFKDIRSKITYLLYMGTALYNFIYFATIPYMAIRMVQAKTSPALIGVIIGAGPLVGMIAGCYLSVLSDRIGRAKLLYIAITYLLCGTLFLSFHYLWFKVLAVCLLSLGKSSFEPISQACLSDITPKAEHKKIFRRRYIAINIGVALGSLAAALGQYIKENIFFMLLIIAVAMYSFVYMKIDKEPITRVFAITRNENPWRSFSFVIKNTSFVIFLMAIILITISYSQFESTLPQFISLNKIEPLYFPLLLMINALGVLILQQPVGKVTHSIKIKTSLVTGGIFISMGFLSMGLSFVHTWLLILGMSLITLGEMMISPLQGVYISEIAPEKQRGAYFGVFNFREIGYVLGPMIGGALLNLTFTGTAFLSITASTLIAALLFLLT